MKPSASPLLRRRLRPAVVLVALGLALGTAGCGRNQADAPGSGIDAAYQGTLGAGPLSGQPLRIAFRPDGRWEAHANNELRHAGRYYAAAEFWELRDAAGKTLGLVKLAPDSQSAQVLIGGPPVRFARAN